MAIQDDISVAANGDIRHTGASSATYTVIEFHRFLQDLADDAVASGDDLLDITYATPSERSTDNIITLNSPYNIDDTLAQYLYDGSITQKNGDEIYSGLVVVGSVVSGTQLQIIQDNQILSSYWGTGLNQDPAANILLRIMVKTRTGGVDIDGKRLRVQARELGDTYSEFSLTAGLGNSTAAIFTSTDLNNPDDHATISAFTGISNVEGLNLIDVSGDDNNEKYYSKWTKGSNTINDLYQWTKDITRRGTTDTLYGMNGELFRGITHAFSYDGESGGPFSQNEILTFGNGATAALLALDDNGTTGDMYVQLLTGTAPSDNDTITGGTSGATANVNGSVSSKTVSPEFLGVSTGSSIIGAYGVGIEATDLTNNDQLFDLTGTLQVPPNYVTFIVGGLVSGEDRVLVGPADGTGNLDVDQFTLATALTTDNITSVQVNSTIPSDTPSSGYIRVLDDDGVYRRLHYSSYSGDTFTIDSTDGNEDFGTVNASANNNVFIAYIDDVYDGTTATDRFTSVYGSDRSLFIRVRDGGSTPIKTFETTATLTSGGGTTTVIRTSDE